LKYRFPYSASLVEEETRKDTSGKEIMPISSRSMGCKISAHFINN
jgi:hypothetical protein